jgi:pyrroline-5-carboxylate reductase
VQPFVEAAPPHHAPIAWHAGAPDMAPKLGAMNLPKIAFIGGGNMATAIIGGLLRQGAAAKNLVVVEPFEAQRARLLAELGVVAQAAADPALANAALVVWAVKPQLFAEAALPCRMHVATALQLSIMAGIRSESIVAASGSPRVVRAMPNTPALVGRGIAALYARAEVDAAGRALATQVLAATGSTLWVAAEDDLDAVTALSGSGPAYVFYFIEAMVQAGTEMGLRADQARQLAQETFAGAAALLMQSGDSPATLRERVTSKGGTTHAAITSLETNGVKAAFVQALHAAQRRAQELGAPPATPPAA